MKENFASNQKKLFRKYLNDECNREELTQLFESLQQSDNRQAYQEVLEDLWKRLSADHSMHTSRADKIFNEIVSQPETSPNKSAMPQQSKQVGWSVPSQWRKMAAVFIGLLIVAGVAYQYIQKPDMLTFSTAYGETQEFWLPDSSKVILNGNSSLSYLVDWKEKSSGAANREIWLEGEAYFEVREIMQEASTTKTIPPSKVKFTVHTSHLNVEVLGTAFNIHNHSDKTQVVLSSGKVKLDLLQEEVLMNPGELVEFNVKDNRIQQKIVNPTLYSSWKDHQLMFEDTPVSEIIQILEDRYGFEISLINKEIGARKFTGTVSTKEIDLLLKAIASSFNLEVTHNGNQITMQYP